MRKSLISIERTGVAFILSLAGLVLALSALGLFEWSRYTWPHWGLGLAEVSLAAVIAAGLFFPKAGAWGVCAVIVLLVILIIDLLLFPHLLIDKDAGRLPGPCGLTLFNYIIVLGDTLYLLTAFARKIPS